MRIEGKVAVVTGAASGIGLATATRFAAEGAKVVAADYPREIPQPGGPESGPTSNTEGTRLSAG